MDSDEIDAKYGIYPDRKKGTPFDWRAERTKAINNKENRPPKRCTVCKEMKDSIIQNFMRNKMKKGEHHPRRGFMEICRVCIERLNEKREVDPRTRMLVSSKQNAKLKEIPHEIRWKDIELPTRCRYLGLEIDYSVASFSEQRKRNSPNIDRIIPSLGYVPGNIQVISDLANRMKTDATIEEMILFANGVLREHGPKKVAKKKPKV